MKVLMITPWYPNSCNPLQGVFVRNHARAIKSAGVEIEVLALVCAEVDSPRSPGYRISWPDRTLPGRAG